MSKQQLQISQSRVKSKFCFKTKDINSTEIKINKENNIPEVWKNGKKIGEINKVKKHG